MQSDITIKHQEGLEFLRSLEKESMDLVLTDPPYEISRETGFIKSLTKPDGSPQSEKTLRRYAVNYKFGEWDEKDMDLFPFLKEMYRVLKKGGTCIVFYDLWKLTPLSNMMKESKFKQLRFIEWIKTNPVPINSKINYLTNSREIALLGVKGGKPTFHSQYDNGIYEYPIQGGKRRTHPTQKNLKLFEHLIKKHSNEGDIILDCFLGSGTTAIAAYNTERNFVGCEMDKKYYHKSVEWLEDIKNG